MPPCREFDRDTDELRIGVATTDDIEDHRSALALPDDHRDASVGAFLGAECRVERDDHVRAVRDLGGSEKLQAIAAEEFAAREHRALLHLTGETGLTEACSLLLHDLGGEPRREHEFVVFRAGIGPADGGGEYARLFKK